MGDNRIAVVTGVTGQDGSYLSEFLLNLGYTVIGVKRRTSTDNTSRIKHITSDKFILIEGDITDSSSISNIIKLYKPNEFYNLAAQSHVHTSFEQPILTHRINSEAILNILEAVVTNSPETKVYQADTSEMFGSNYSIEDGKKFQNEDTPFSPRSPYAVSKVAAHNYIGLYRDSYNIFACSGVLFNHDSPRRGENFVTRKITKWIGEFVNFRHKYSEHSINFEEEFIVINNKEKTRFPKLRLGNLKSYRDFGHAVDYVEAMWLMLQQDQPRDYVIATSKPRTVQEFLEKAFGCIGIENPNEYVFIDLQFFRPAEVDYLCGDYSRAKHYLGWSPKISFDDLVKEMVESDTEKL